MPRGLTITVTPYGEPTRVLTQRITLESEITLESGQPKFAAMDRVGGEAILAAHKLIRDTWAAERHTEMLDRYHPALSPEVARRIQAQGYTYVAVNPYSAPRNRVTMWARNTTQYQPPGWVLVDLEDYLATGNIPSHLGVVSEPVPEVPEKGEPDEHPD